LHSYPSCQQLHRCLLASHSLQNSRVQSENLFCDTFSHLQITINSTSLPDGYGGVSPTLPSVVRESKPSLVCLQENLASLGRPWGHHQLEFYPPWWKCYQDRGSRTFNSIYSGD
jgi:hypothetical protein